MPDDPLYRAPAEKQAHASSPPLGKPGGALRMLAWAVTLVLSATLACVLLAALAAHMQISTDQLWHWRQVASGVRHWGTFVQCLILAAIGLGWRAIVALGFRRGIVKPQEREQLIRLRGKVLAFGVAYLLLVPIGPATLWRYLVP